MQFPDEIQAIINQYAKPASAMLREDWREGSSIIKILKQDRWWIDYVASRQAGYRLATTTTSTATWTWVDWCKDKMIIGPHAPAVTAKSQSWMKSICHGMISNATAVRGLKRGLIPMITPGAKSGQSQIGRKPSYIAAGSPTPC